MPLPMFQDKAKKTLGVGSVKKIYAVASGKGGVGKSTLTAIMASFSAIKGKKVGLLDADLYGPSIKKLLPEDRPARQEDQTIWPAFSQGIKVMTLAFFRPDYQASLVRAPVANGMLQQMLHQVVWGDLDELWIDFPPGTGDIQLTLIQQLKIDGVLLVSTPQEIALLDVMKTHDMFDQLKVPVMGFVENMGFFMTGDRQHFIFGPSNGESFARERGIPFLGVVPLDPQIALNCDQGKSLVTEQASSYSYLENIYDNFSKQALSKKVTVDSMGIDKLKKWSQAPILNLKVDEHQEEPLGKIVGLFKAGPFSLGVVGDNQQLKVLPFSLIQSFCPCASCIEKSKKSVMQDERSVLSVLPIGQYAVKFIFEKGCNYGIFDFDLLRKIYNESSLHAVS